VSRRLKLRSIPKCADMKMRFIRAFAFAGQRRPAPSAKAAPPAGRRIELRDLTCHIVDPANASPRVVVIGPKFQDIANTNGMTATALRVFLTTSHPKMPNLILTPEQVADVSAYILSLREQR
jgi:hypothetical protein